MDKSWDLIDDLTYDKDAGLIYGGMIRHIEKIVIIKALQRSEGSQVEAAKILGLHRNTLHNKIRKLKIDVRKFKR